MGTCISGYVIGNVVLLSPELLHSYFYSAPLAMDKQFLYEI